MARVPSKKQTIFGYKFHLLVTLSGVILDFTLAPANINDLTIGEDLLSSYTDPEVLGDKAFISASVAARLAEENRAYLRTLPRANQKRQVSPRLRRQHNQARQIIETVNGQLAEQFQIELNHAHTCWGPCTHLLTNSPLIHSQSI
jgi:hypothetical protein